MKSLALHLGAHKTATTHIQESLKLVASELEKENVKYVPIQEIRENRRFIKKNTRLIDFFTSYLTGGNTALFEYFDAFYTQGTNRVVFSEEDIIGLPRDGFKNPPYRNARNNLRALSAISKNFEIEIFFSIRSFSSFAPSIYSQLARTGKIKGFLTIKKSLMRNKPSWFPLILNISKAFPESKITIWRYEDYSKNTTKILHKITQTTDVIFPFINPPPSTKALSHECITMIEEAVSGLSRKKQIEISEILCRDDSGKIPYRPFLAPELSHLDDLYHRDIDLIKEISTVRFLEF